MAAAVGSFSRRSTFRPASLAASLVAWRWASSKYAGTVMTAPTRSSPSVFSARWRSVARISADTSTGLFTPATVLSCTMPGASTKSYGVFSMWATSLSPRPMKRLTETMVFFGSRTASTWAL